MVCFFILLAQVGTQTACTKGPVVSHQSAGARYK